MLVCICLSAIVVIKYRCLHWNILVVLRCWTVFKFTVELKYLIVWSIDINLIEVFALTYGKGIPVFYCICVYIYICG